jgi:hypothetical protein
MGNMASMGFKGGIPDNWHTLWVVMWLVVSPGSWCPS